MRRLGGRIVGIILVVGAVSGLVFSVLGLFAVQRAEQQVTTEVLSGLDLLDQTLRATADGLAVANDSLETASATIGSVETTVDGISETLDETTPVLNSIAELMGGELPDTVRTTRRSLDAAATSARAVDDTLETLSSIPLLGLDRYQPQTPLHESIGDVSGSLADLPASLASVQTGLETTSGNLDQVAVEVAQVASNVSQMDDSIADAQSVVTDYQDVVAQLQTGVSDLRAGLPRAIYLLGRVISLILVWLGITQVGLLTQGLEIIRRS